MATTTDMYTFDDFVDYVGEDQKAHLLEGMIIMESPATPRHERLQNFLAILVGTYVSEKGLGEAYGPHVAYKLAEYDGVEPDLSFISQERLGRVRGAFVDGPPDLAVEIVSKGTRKLDYEKKRPAYEASGLRELWIIDDLQGRTELFKLQDGRFDQERLEGGDTLRSVVLPGVELRMEDLLTDPLPRPRPILEELLST